MVNVASAVITTIQTAIFIRIGLRMVSGKPMKSRDMELIQATKEMLEAAHKIVPTQEDVLSKGFIQSGEIMCLGTNEKGMYGQYWDIFVNTCFNGMTLHCRQSLLSSFQVDNSLELQVYKESPNLYCARDWDYSKNETVYRWQEAEQVGDTEELHKCLSIIPEDKEYLVFTLQDFFNQGQWGWYFDQRCLRFIGVCKINRKLSEQRNTIVWDIVKEKYSFK